MELSRLVQLSRGLTDAPDLDWVGRIRLRSFSDALEIGRPRNVMAVIALRPRGQAARSLTLPLIAVSRFRSPLSIIERISQTLADTIVATAVIPIIDPLGA